MKTTENNGQPTRVKCFELRYKDTNEIISVSLSEQTIRKEAINYKEDIGNMNDIYVAENFMKIEEWNNAMLSALKY